MIENKISSNRWASQPWLFGSKITLLPDFYIPGEGRGGLKREVGKTSPRKIRDPNIGKHVSCKIKIWQHLETSIL